MAEKQLSDGNPDGVNMGQSTSDLIGFYGVANVAQQATAAAGTDAATTQALANALKLAMDNLGFTA